MTSRPPDVDLTLCWGTLRGVGLQTLLSAAAIAGFEHVTASIVEHRSDLGSGIEDVRDVITSTGVDVICVEPVIRPLPGLPHPGSVHERLRAYLEYELQDVLDAAVAIGATYVNIAHFLGRSGDIDSIADAVGNIAKHAQIRGLEATLEFIPGTGIANLADALHVLDRCQSDNVRLMIDTYHLHNSGGVARDFDRIPSGLVRAIQVSDTAVDLRRSGSDFSQRLMPGKGTLPLAALIDAARRNNPSVELHVEVFNEDLLKQFTPAQVATAAREAVDLLT